MFPTQEKQKLNQSRIGMSFRIINFCYLIDNRMRNDTKCFLNISNIRIEDLEIADKKMNYILKNIYYIYNNYIFVTIIFKNKKLI